MHRAPYIIAGLLVFVLAGGFLIGGAVAGSPRLPRPALDALTAHVTAGGGGGAGPVRLLEVRRIGPDIAVIYRTGRQPGAALLSGGHEDWTVVAQAGDAGLLLPAPGDVGAAQLCANDLLVVFVGIADPRVGQVMIRFPDDGTALKAPRHGDFAILWRPAAHLPAGFVTETYDRRGRPLPR